MTRPQSAPASERGLPPNDQALVAKVSSEVLGRWRELRGRVILNSCSGVVDLRGTCDTNEQIAALESEARAIQGVVDVRNYLHLPGRTGDRPR